MKNVDKWTETWYGIILDIIDPKRWGLSVIGQTLWKDTNLNFLKFWALDESYEGIVFELF